MKIEEICLWKSILDNGKSFCEIRYRDLTHGCYNCDEKRTKECKDYIPLEVIKE